jgi:enoyl-CoA hydratase/carnithine racemase
MVSSLHDLAIPTIAAVNGPAVGVGMDLALCCDLVVASDAALFSMAYAQRGLVPDGGGLYYLPRRVGLARAKELIFTGRRIGAPEALALGIADRVVPAVELEQAAITTAHELGQGSRTATALAKAILNRTFESTREEVYARSIEAQAICYTTDEHRDSVAAFLDASEKAESSDRPDHPRKSDA